MNPPPQTDVEPRVPGEAEPMPAAAPGGEAVEKLISVAAMAVVFASGLAAVLV